MTWSQPLLANRRPTPAWLLLAAVAAGGCFPLPQTAEVEPGFHVDGGLVVLADQRRNDREQGTDMIPWVAPTYGFGDGLEIGLPIGAYFEEGLDSRTGVGSRIEPLIGLSVKGRVFESGRHRLFFAGQTALVLPASAGLIYGYELDRWLPHVAVKRVFSWGPAGDDPLVTRYQEDGQSLWVFAAGGRVLEDPNLAFEVGVLRNAYDEGAVYGDFGQPTTRRTLYDLFVATRVRF